MNKREFRQLLCSMLIGDGTLEKNRCFFQLSHSPKQYDYLKWKMDKIQKIFDEKNLQKTIKIHKVIYKVQGKKYPGYQGRFYWKKYLKFLVKKVYPQHRQYKKSIEFLLSQINSPLHLAIWLADDGHEVKRKTTHVDGTEYWCNPYYTLILGKCTDGEVELAHQWFMKYFQVESRRFKDGKGCWNIWFRAKDSKILFQKIGSYLNEIPSMRDKFWLSFVKYQFERPSIPY